MHITIAKFKGKILSLTHLSQFLQDHWTYYNETWTTEILLKNPKRSLKKGLKKFGSGRGCDT